MIRHRRSVQGIGHPGSYPELRGHSFDILRLTKVGECWLAHVAVDGRLYPPFFEPHSNVIDMDELTFLDHIRSQALTMQQYVEQSAGRA